MPFNKTLVQDKPDVNEDESYFFRVTEAIFVGWFTLEYIIRFLVAPDKVKKLYITFVSFSQLQ